MYETSGNTAYSLQRKPITVKRHAEQTRQYRKRHNADPKRVVLKTVSAESGSVALHKQMAKQRLGRIFACVFAVAMLTAVFAGILYRNSNILELNYANIRIEREIKRIEMESYQLKEEMAKKTDLKLIRQLAVSRLGMQDPGLHQIVNVVIPVSDKIIIEQDSQETDDMDSQLNNTFTNIEGYFKTIR